MMMMMMMRNFHIIKKTHTKNRLKKLLNFY
jgi:hypothetical protein